MLMADASIIVHGFQGVLYILAALAFLAAAIISWFVMPRNHWATLVSLGLLFWVLTGIFKG
jgi:hypothetical protein